MNPSVKTDELTEQLAGAFSRLHQLLLAEKLAVQNLDRKRMDQLESEIARVMEEKDALLDRVRQRMAPGA